MVVSDNAPQIVCESLAKMIEDSINLALSGSGPILHPTRLVATRISVSPFSCLPFDPAERNVNQAFSWACHEANESTDLDLTSRLDAN